jgi:hypothetical protein
VRTAQPPDEKPVAHMTASSTQGPLPMIECLARFNAVPTEFTSGEIRMMQPAAESTNQPNRSDSSAIKQKTPTDSRRPWHVEGARPSRPTTRSRVRRVAGGYVDPHSRSGGFRGGESSIEQRPGLLGHDCIAPNTTSSVVSPVASWRALCRSVTCLSPARRPEPTTSRSRCPR